MNSLFQDGITVGWLLGESFIVDHGRRSVIPERLVDALMHRPAEVITPRDPRRRGAQLSVRISDRDAGTVTRRLREEYGVFTDARQPDVIRLAPAPMYNTFHDCWRAATALASVLDGLGNGLGNGNGLDG
jgi:kynureninase